MMPDEEEEHRDDSDDRPRRRRVKKSNRSLWLTLGLIGGIAVLGCGGLAVFGVTWAFKSITTDLPAANSAASQFLDLLQQNKVDEAYAATSAGWQSRESLDQFRGFVGRFETFTGATSRSVNGSRLFQDQNGKRVFVQVTLQAPKNAMTCTLVVLEQDGAWKVDKITVP